MDRPQHILVAEDEFFEAIALDRFLSAQGYRVTLARDGHHALLRFQNDPVDALITDFHMPRMNGAELIRRALHLRPGLPIIVTSAHAQLEEVLQAAGPQTLGFIPKPIDFERLRTTLHAAFAV